MTPDTIPSFSRVEIKHGNKDEILLASLELKTLAEELAFIAGERRSDDEAAIIAHHKIKSVSRKLRGTV